MNDQFLKILARKYNLKYTHSELEENSTPDKQNISNVKTSESNSTPDKQNISNVKISESISTPNKKHITHVKMSKYLLLNGVSDSTNPNKYILKSLLESKHKLFEMFNVNITALEGKLTQIFQPLTDFLVLLDKKFQGQLQNENNLDFVL